MTQPTATVKPKFDDEIRMMSRAVREVKRIKSENTVPDSCALRVGVKGGGCSGFTYVLAFDDNARAEDKELEIEEIKIVVDPKSLFFLSGTELDFSDGLNGKGFVFSNPHATKTCGCGNSFGV